MHRRLALPVTALALTLSACSGASNAENVTLSNDSPGIENLVSEDLELNDSGLVDTDATLNNIDDGATAIENAGDNDTVNAL